MEPRISGLVRGGRDVAACGDIKEYKTFVYRGGSAD